MVEWWIHRVHDLAGVFLAKAFLLLSLVSLPNGVGKSFLASLWLMGHGRLDGFLIEGTRLNGLPNMGVLWDKKLASKAFL